MRVLGLQGSPRRNGNAHFLLSGFMAEAEKLGAQTHTVLADKQDIQPCKEYVVCEKKGYCPIEDDMKREIFSLIRWADIIVAASPVYFFNVTAQLKALIDRCQTFWARKYRFKLRDSNAGMRRGCMLAVGASRGKKLFDGVHLTAKYFFDAVDATYDNHLVYPGIEKYGEMAGHPTVREDIKALVAEILAPFQGRKKILFACRENACRSQMAGAFARMAAGDRLEVYVGGSQPADEVNPMMISAMAEKGIDMAFQRPRSIESALLEGAPDVIVTMGCGEACPHVPGARRLDWNLPDPAGGGMETMRGVRDDIEKKVAELIGTL
jgi:multimeric flavodoxin WrbA/protein-tyrosine-phosphatase